MLARTHTHRGFPSSKGILVLLLNFNLFCLAAMEPSPGHRHPSPHHVIAKLAKDFTSIHYHTLDCTSKLFTLTYFYIAHHMYIEANCISIALKFD